MAVMAGVTVVEVRLADRLVTEHGLIEWLQVILSAGAALISGRRAALERIAGRSAAQDLLLTAGFTFLAVSEMELPATSSANRSRSAG